MTKTKNWDFDIQDDLKILRERCIYGYKCSLRDI